MYCVCVCARVCVIRWVMTMRRCTSLALPMARADLSCVTICGRMRLMWGARLMFMCAGHMEVWLCGASRRDGLCSFSTNLVLAPHPFSTPAFSISSMFALSLHPAHHGAFTLLPRLCARGAGAKPFRVMTCSRALRDARAARASFSRNTWAPATRTPPSLRLSTSSATRFAPVGFDSLAQYIAVAENESIARVKFNSLQKMIQPCGPPPPKEDE